MDGHPAAEIKGPDANPLLERIGGIWAGRTPGLQEEFQREVAQLLGRGRNLSFPGAQPVSFSAEHIQELKTQDYYVCEKTDGLRYLMYLTREGEHDIHYLIDRKNDYWFVPYLHFPHHEDKTFERFHTDTILDGELVEDRYPDRPPVIKFLVFDCLVLDKQILMQRPLDKRLAYFKSHVLGPYKEMYKQQPDRPQPFVLEDKATEFSYGLEKMFKEIIPKVKQLHGNDGLIFTCRNTPYKTGTDEHILKWKPPAENTVDFLLHIEWPKMDPDPDDPDRSPQPDYYAFPSRFSLYIHHGSNEYSYVDDLYVEPHEYEEWKTLGHPLQDIIVEAAKDDEQRWRYHRFRHDKEQSNHIKVYKSVIRSIQSHVTEQDLLDHAGDIRSAWKARDEERKRIQAGVKRDP
jgi:mRNA guanylyltransferase